MTIFHFLDFEKSLWRGCRDVAQKVSAEEMEEGDPSPVTQSPTWLPKTFNVQVQMDPVDIKSPVPVLDWLALLNFWRLRLAVLAIWCENIFKYWEKKLYIDNSDTKLVWRQK